MCSAARIIRSCAKRSDEFLGEVGDAGGFGAELRTAVTRLLEAEDLRADPGAVGQLSVALTDPPDAFLDVARKRCSSKSAQWNCAQ